MQRLNRYHPDGERNKIGQIFVLIDRSSRHDRLSMAVTIRSVSFASLPDEDLPFRK